MLYNKHKLLTRDDKNVKEPIDGIINDQEYWVYSYIIEKKGKKANIIYNVQPIKVLAKIKNNSLFVVSVKGGYRFFIFSAYGRHLYFADNQEEAERAYNRLVNKENKIFNIE